MLKINIQLFADGGEAGGSNGNAAAFDADAEIAKRFPEEARAFAAAHKKADAQPEPKQADAPAEKTERAGDDADPDNTHGQEEFDEDAEFDKLIKGPYKDAFRKRFQSGLNDRFKGHNAEVQALQQKIEAYQDAVAAYAMKLGVDPNDVDALSAAVMEDKNNFRQRAVEKGITLEEAIADFQTEREAEKKSAAEEAQARAVQDEQAQRQAMQQRQQLYENWKAQEAEIQKRDASFDLKTELMNNAEFRKAVDAGMSLDFAYKATRFDQTMANVAGAVERQTALNTAKQIAAGRNRPTEGGLGTAPAAKTQTSYKDMSDKEFLKLFRSMGY